MKPESKPPSRSIRKRLTKVLRRFLILFLYLWVLLGLFVLNEDLVDRSRGDAFIFQGFAILNAFILAKVMLAAEHLDVGRWLRRLPLAATILLEAAFCTTLFMIVHVLERVLVGVFHGQGVAASLPSFGGGGVAGTAIVSAIICVSLLPFFTVKHVARAIGPDRLQAILFHSRGGRSPSPTDEDARHEA